MNSMMCFFMGSIILEYSKDVNRYQTILVKYFYDARSRCPSQVLSNGSIILDSDFAVNHFRNTVPIQSTIRMHVDGCSGFWYNSFMLKRKVAKMLKMQSNPIPRNALWATPTLDQISAQIEDMPNDDRAMMYHVMMLTLNACNKLVQDSVVE